MQPKQKGHSRHQKHQKHSRAEDWLLNLALLICVIIFCVAAKEFYTIYRDYRYGSEVYANLIEQAVIAPSSQAATAPTAPAAPQVQGQTLPEYAEYQVDFATLRGINSDIVAWIRFDAPEIINYPVLACGDNETYLHTNVYGETNGAGCLFLEANNCTDFTDNNTVIFGHNMRNNSMFGALSDYISEDFCTAHPYFYLYTPDGTARQYQIVTVCEVSTADTDRFTLNFATEESQQAYINTLLRTSYYDTGTPIETGDSLVTLATCTASETRRLIVQAVLIDRYPEP